MTRDVPSKAVERTQVSVLESRDVMAAGPIVSVIIPTYRRAHLVRAAVDSVLTQTFQAFEIIVVEDGSTRETRGVIEALSDDRVRYVGLEAHGGVARARNVGLTHARGKLIAFLDDDDEWLPEKLMVQVTLLESASSVGLVHTGWAVVDHHTGQRWVVRCREENERLFVNYISTSSIVARRECFEAVGMFDERLEANSDYDMWIRIQTRFALRGIDRALVRYFVHDDRISTRLASKIRASEILLAKHRRFFAENPAALSGHHLALGVRHCYNGDLTSGRRHFVRAIWLHPRAWNGYVNLCATAFGARVYGELKRLWEARRIGGQGMRYGVAGERAEVPNRPLS